MLLVSAKNMDVRGKNLRNILENTSNKVGKLIRNLFKKQDISEGFENFQDTPDIQELKKINGYVEEIENILTKSEIANTRKIKMPGASNRELNIRDFFIEYFHSNLVSLRDIAPELFKTDSEYTELMDLALQNQIDTEQGTAKATSDDVISGDLDEEHEVPNGYFKICCAINNKNYCLLITETKVSGIKHGFEIRLVENSDDSDQEKYGMLIEFIELNQNINNYCLHVHRGNINLDDESNSEEWFAPQSGSELITSLCQAIPVQRFQHNNKGDGRIIVFNAANRQMGQVSKKSLLNLYITSEPIKLREMGEAANQKWYMEFVPDEQIRQRIKIEQTWNSEEVRKLQIPNRVIPPYKNYTYGFWLKVNREIRSASDKLFVLVKGNGHILDDTIRYKTPEFNDKINYPTLFQSPSISVVSSYANNNPLDQEQERGKPNIMNYMIKYSFSTNTDSEETRLSSPNILKLKNGII